MRLLWSIFICTVLCLPALAQTPQNRGKRIEAVKIAFITQKLDLSSSEAERFWPVYNNYQKEIAELIRQKRQSRLSNDKTVTADEKLNGELNFEGRILDVRKKYKKEFSKVIPDEKVLKLYQAEREFREQLIKQLKERKNQ